MSDIYNLFSNLRDETRNIKGSKEVLNQLMLIAFNNNVTPDTLPNVFNINDVHLNTSEFKQLMEVYNFEVDVEMITRDWFSHTASFKITMMKES